MATPNELILFSWLHLSDIHFGHGAASDKWDQKLVLCKLQEDIESSIKNGFQKPDVVFMTGDIANTGDVNPDSTSKILGSSEYEAAGNWLSTLSTAIGIDNQSIYMVPGNHDIQRDVAIKNRNLNRLLDNLREHRESIDEVLDNPEERQTLKSRMNNFIQFSRNYAPNCLSDTLCEDLLYWQHTLKTSLGFCVRVIGLNTAILSTGDSDKKKLFLGSEQLGKLISPDSTEQTGLVIALSHHPFNWLNDERNVCSWVQSNCHIHLHGHLHENNSTCFQTGGGSEIINACAGSVHADNGDFVKYGYTRASIIADSSEKKIKLRIWARTWSDNNKDFRADVDNIFKGKDFAEYNLNLTYFDYAKLEDSIINKLSTPIITDVNAVSDNVEINLEEYNENEIPIAPSDFPPVLPAWVGREVELELLSDSAIKIIAITGIGGQGKSALASRYIQILSESNVDVSWDWRDCREHGDTLQTHILRIIERLSGGRITGASFAEDNITSIIDYFFNMLGNTSWVFIFDNIDHYVDAELSKPIHGMKYLIESSLHRRHNAKFIFTCRPALTYDDNLFFQISLSGLSVSETQQLFELRGVVIDSPHIKRNIADAQMITQGHPLWLNLIATQVSKNKANLESLLTDIKKGKNIGLPTTMLRSIWKTLNDKQRWVLRCMAEAVRPETEEQLFEYLSVDLNWNQFSKALRSLKSLDLVVVKTAPNSKDTLELHPVVRTFLITEFPRSEREKFIIRIANTFDKIIIKLRGSISSGASIFILEHWTLRAELAINAGNYADALKALADVSNAILAAGHVIEFIRVCKRLFEEINFTDAILNEYKFFDQVFADFIDTLSHLERFEEAEQFLSKYSEIVVGKSSRYVNLCDLQCYLNWTKGEYDTAIDWGNRGVKLKNDANLDTRFDCSHNLALANRDSGSIDSALEYFIKDTQLADILDPSHINKENGGQYYGNIGRCFYLKGDIDNALICYKKSAKLLEYQNDKQSVMNRGWVSQWIGEALEKQHNNINAWYFFKKAFYVWQEVSPQRSRQALMKADEILMVQKIIINDANNYNAIERKCRLWIESN